MYLGSSSPFSAEGDFSFWDESWYDNYFNARSMDVYITKLRKHLKDDPDIEINNVHGKGYRLIAQMQED